MTVQLVLLKSGEELVADVREIVDKETEKQLSLVLINPHVIAAKTNDMLTFDPWIPLSASREFFVPYDWVVTITQPQENIVDEFNKQFGENNDDQSNFVEDTSELNLGD